jgi:aminoglycoside phosphotransferase family enzyme
MNAGSNAASESPHHSASTTSAAREENRLVAGLKSSAAYDHPAAGVCVIETHISRVFLAGEYAYKVKKPVSLGFADFSTLERRRHFCEEEVRLNRRLAPDLYLGVAPITGTTGAIRVGGDGEPIEYAIRMRRFPQEALLGRVLDRGELRPEHIDALAAEIASFHARIPAAPPGSSFGIPDPT